MVLLALVAFSQAELVNGVDITGVTEKTVDVAETININITDFGNVDWNLFNATNGLTSPAESKLGGTAFGNYSSTIDVSRVSISDNRSIEFNWTDGTVVASTNGMEMDLKVSTFDLAANQEEVVAFDVTIPASGHDYIMRLFLTDQRMATALNV